MRRNDREIKDFDKLINVIDKCEVCRLALFDEEYPYILPLNYGYSVVGNQITLYFHGAKEGKKHDLISINNKASFEMDCSHKLVEKDDMCTMEYESIIGNGIIEIVSEGDKLEAMNILMANYHKEGMEYNTAVLEHVTMYKLKVYNITGKAHKVTQ